MKSLKINKLLIIFLFFTLICNFSDLNAQKDPNYSTKTIQSVDPQMQVARSGILATEKLNLRDVNGNNLSHYKLVQKVNSDFHKGANTNRPRVPGEIIHNRTEKQFFVDNGNGTISQTSSNLPLHYMVGGRWYPIDNTIVQNPNSPYPNHTFTNQTNDFQSYFSENLLNGFITRFEDDLELVDMLDAKMFVVNVDDEVILNSEVNQKINTSKSPIIVESTGLVYEEVYSGIDMNLILSNNKRKLDYVIKDNSFLSQLPADAEYLVFEEKISFPENLRPVINDNGGVDIFDHHDKLKSHVPFPSMHDDSNTKLYGDDLPKIYFKLFEANNIHTLQLYVKLDWLKNENRVFPIYIDPTLTGSNSSIEFEDALHNAYCNDYADYEDVTTSGAAGTATITDFSYSVSSTPYYWTNCSWGYYDFSWIYCGSYVHLRPTNTATSTYSDACGTGTSTMNVNISSTFDGESPNTTWRFTAVSDDGDDYSIHFGSIDVTVTYIVPSPTITSFTPSSVCASSSESVTITGANLSSANSVTIGGTAATITSNSTTQIVVTVGAGTTGTVSVTTAGGTATSSSSVTVNAKPNGPTLSGGGSICSGATLAASGSGGTIYWQGTNSSGTSTSDAGATSPVITSSGSYYAKVQSSAGCWSDASSAEVVSAVNPLPTNLVATADGASSVDICSGGSSQLSGSADDETVATTESGSQTFNWSGSSKYDGGTASVLGDYVEGTISGLPADATITSITYSTDINYCSNGSANCATWWGAELYVNGTYQALACDVTNASYSGLNSSIANGNVLRLWIYDTDNWNDCTNITFDVTVNYEYSGTTNVAATYSWSPSTGLSATNIANPVASPTSSQTYTVTAAYTSGCTSTATASVTANGLPSNSSVAISSNSTPPRNNDDITATISTSDPESAAVYSENDWRVNGTSFAVQNLSFDANGSDGLTSNSSQGGALTAYGDATQVAGVKGQAYEFDGVNDYLQNSSVNIDPSNGLSISLWQYTITTASSSGNDAYHQWVNLGPGQQMVLRNSFTNGVEAYVSTGGNLTGWCSGCGTGDFIYLTNQVSAGSWNHWVVTWNPDRTFKLYKNGTLIKTNVAAAGALSTITSLSISGNSAENFNGKIDELLVFERDISADQVTALYNSGTPSYSTIANDETSCGESWALSSNPVDAAGCSGSTTTSTAVAISGAQVTTADVTDVTTCGLDNYAIAIDDANDVGVWEVSPANAALIDDPSAPSTTVTASPTANPTSGFNSDLTFTWTPTDNNCASDNVMIKFNQPVITGTMDNYCWAWGGGTSDDWSSPSNWYKWDGSKWAIQSSSYPDAGSKVYILPTSSMCVTNGAMNASASFEDLNIQGGSFDLGSANTSITGDIINNGGTLLAGSGTVTFNGSGAQSITGSGVNTNFNNLIINNSNDISSDIQIVVENELTMISGNIDNSSPLILG
ncbi:IPT/TIG domain-containing protein, partial [Crocinitomicaceae bacterium]|nr:IPT/TIG domain-containing protein [Crocinitomicaceae bacterium]